jgi:hypothetical protein
LYGAGPKAKCRQDCSGYDVAACVYDSTKAEIVQPAARDAALWSDAQCNENGAFPFVVQRRPSKRWVIRLEGGGACSPAGGAPCYTRPDRLSSPYLDDKAVTDRETRDDFPLDQVPAGYADANYARLVYCSSDAWTGTQNAPIMIDANAAGTAKKPWRFSGRANVRATIEILKQRYGLDDADPETRIFFSGGSAGGHGVLHNIDQLTRAMPKTAAAKRTWAFANAASYFIGWKVGDATVDGDWSALDSSGAHSGAYWEEGLPLILDAWKADLGSPQCEAAFPGQRQNCFFLGQLEPFIIEPAPKGLGVPLAVANNLEDPNPQDEFGIVTRTKPVAFSAGGELASKAWGDVHKSKIAGLRWVFAAREPLGFHGARYSMKGASTPTLQSLLDAFVSKADPDPFSFIDFAPLPE